MPDGVSAKAGSIERGQGRAGVASGVACAGRIRDLVGVSSLHLVSLDTGPNSAFRQVYPEGISVVQAPDDAPRGGLRREEGDPGPPGSGRWEPVCDDRDARFEPAGGQGPREEIQAQEPWPTPRPTATDDEQLSGFDGPGSLLFGAEDPARSRYLLHAWRGASDGLHSGGPARNEAQLISFLRFPAGRFGQDFPQLPVDRTHVVQGISEAREEVGCAHRAGWNQRWCLGGEHPDHTREIQLPGLPRNGREMDEQLRSRARREPGPQRVGEREAVYESPDAWPAVEHDGDGGLGRVPGEGREAQSIRNDIERYFPPRGDDRREIQPQRGEEEPGELPGAPPQADRQAVEPPNGAERLEPVSDPLSFEHHATPWACSRRLQPHRPASCVYDRIAE